MRLLARLAAAFGGAQRRTRATEWHAHRWAASDNSMSSAAGSNNSMSSAASSNNSMSGAARSDSSMNGAAGRDSFMNGAAGSYIEHMYEAYRTDPALVHASWRSYFASLDGGTPSARAFAPVPPDGAPPPGGEAVQPMAIEEHMKVQLLIRAYQVRGHLRARIDPLSIMQPDRDFSPAPELEPSYYGFGPADMHKRFQLGAALLPSFSRAHPSMTLQEIVDSLQRIYCGPIGYEYSHIPDRARCDWLRKRIEVDTPFAFTPTQKAVILDRLAWADAFERFVAKKWPGEKRFGLEGAEALIPGLKAIIDRVVDVGVDHVVIGMAHRGRLNVLTNVVRKPVESIFSEFSGVIGDSGGHSGDVKYHLGMNYVRPTPNGKKINLSLVANPSHLEAVDPVVLGKTRAIQFFFNDIGTHERAMALLIHGDAAFAGQGVVYETLGLADLPSYTTGGTIHVIVNNQIGFTTDPRFARSTPYCSDLAKTIAAPILHVNGDDIEAVVHACQLAVEWRSIFKTDFVIDLVCYRRHGHNEMDQPLFTQPRMYNAIAKQPTCLALYGERLVREGTLTGDELKAGEEKIWAVLEEAYSACKEYKPTNKEWLTSNWTGFMSPKELQERIAPARKTGVPTETLREIGLLSSSYPADFAVHAGIKRIMEARRETIEKGENIDMPTAEALAFGSLLVEGNHIRLSGQDVERGTFSQRHAVLHNQEEEKVYIPLAHITKGQAPFAISNSSLSEYGVLGFELGYSLVSPHALVIWEAQFGDFANSAQVMIDQFIASGERKWLQRSGLTLLLPHGYDGAGPEHSNAHVERFLSLCDDHPDRPVPSDDALSRQMQDCNLQVVNPSTPANYFHVLRRQLHRDFRKPLVVLTSKNLLRHPLARSALAEMAEGTAFAKVIPSAPAGKEEKVRRVIFCSGQVYYALARAIEANALREVAVARIEQISPFPYDQVVRECDRFPNATALVWCQEEAMNLGPWSYVEPRVEAALRAASNFHAGRRLAYAGREPSAAVATGYKKQHVAEEHALLAAALLGGPARVKSVQVGVPIWKQ